MKKFTLTIFAMVLLSSIMIAQELLDPVDAFSRKKTCYLTMDDGSKIEGTIKDLDLKKGIIEEIKIQDGNGKKVKIKPDNISHMYLPAHGVEKYFKAKSFLTDATRWKNKDLDQALFGQGYAYFEKSEVMVKKKRMTLMVQLLNPQFSDKVKIYHDPRARETMSFGVGGVKLAGGLDKSYYVKVMGKPAAVELRKKDYKEEFRAFFDSCDSVTKMKPDWEDFPKHVYTMATECN